jgi:hypothetical protein
VAARVAGSIPPSIAPSVTLTDCHLGVIANLEANVRLNGLAGRCRIAAFDFYQRPSDREESFPGGPGTCHEPVDVILAADVICQPADSTALASCIRQILRPGGKAFVVCASSVHRFGVDCFAGACESAGLVVAVDPIDLADMSAQVRGYLRQSCGFVENMTFDLYKIQKPVNDSVGRSVV